MLKRRNFFSTMFGGLFILSSHSYVNAYTRKLRKTIKNTLQKRFHSFLLSIRKEAISQGLPPDSVDDALNVIQTPNENILKRDKNQPEFKLSWQSYKDRIITQDLLQMGQAAYSQDKSIMSSIIKQFGADDFVVMGIWGLESRFGLLKGTFNIINALATLAFDARRSIFFKVQLIDALKISINGNIPPTQMMGSYAGAIGQPQFMPTAYLNYAVSTNATTPDIWNNTRDVWGSIANFLSKHNWHQGEGWGLRVSLPKDVNGKEFPLASLSSKNAPTRFLKEWIGLGVKKIDGTAILPDQPSQDINQQQLPLNDDKKEDEKDLKKKEKEAEKERKKKEKADAHKRKEILKEKGEAGLAEFLEKEKEKTLPPSQPTLTSDMTGKLIQPDGEGTEAYLVFHNFSVIRTYNPSDYYALTVCLLGEACIKSS